ncbi:D-aspartate oxidase [Spathaspora passalidarum NRRL Y-27907]|uniref:D-aspartate oxidase n=1 Tax=Spathaspora passalidarum (strain NRRL Y-27907 / 11-Y1) TaxID=619300 RepID=G3ANF3_SPAPN|nr:D-aspartate oxidase [Spathaspora passalidarum NRRL Y-27907]EGW31942.1 D-aspartate oxidase [Spathaspora passalidarum NRRL Y-27907]
MTKYVIVGSGIIGLYTTFQLLEHHIAPHEITVIAEYMPGDESINYTSPYAGGNFSCITGDDPDTLEFDKYTYLNLHRIQKVLGKEAGLDRYPSVELWDRRPAPEKIESLSSYLDQYDVITEKDELDGAEFGIRFLSWNFNCPKFLANFQKYLEKQGVRFVKKRLSHIVQAYGPSTKTVINCSGIGARTLGGVEDKQVYPTRGQVVVIKAPHIMENKMRWGDDYATYIIKRPYSHDQLILGGFIQKDNWTGDTFKSETEDILNRTTTLLPKILLKNPGGDKVEDLEILRVAAGLRPSRHGGARIERESFDEGKVLIHNYGASGYGYQAGLGMAYKAVQLAVAKSKL